IGQLRVPRGEGRRLVMCSLESVASGRGMSQVATEMLRSQSDGKSQLWEHRETLTAAMIGNAAAAGDFCAVQALGFASHRLAQGLCHVIALLCPKRIVIGGGVSLMGEELFFAPLRRLVAESVFEPFAGLTDIVPAALGEEVVVHGAIALARQRL